MSQLDRHIAVVRTKMTLSTFVTALAWTGTALGAGVLVVVLLERLARYTMPRHTLSFWIASGVAVAASIAYAIFRRPTARQAAVAIDERLGLQEKFSTALYVRPSRDPFAAAAVRDAEKTAASVKLHDRFPVRFPIVGIATIVVALLAFGTAWLLPTFDLFGVQARRDAVVKRKAVERVAALREVKHAIEAIDSALREVAQNEEIKMAERELNKFLEQPSVDAPKATSRARDALHEMEAIKQHIKEASNFAVSQELSKMSNIGPPPSEETGPMADAHREMAKNNVEAAVADMKKAVDKFQEMDQKEKEKAADQAKKLAQALANKANDPAVQKQIQQQLQNAGMNQQQAQKMAQQMQAAANGSQQAQKQLQQQLNQAIQLANSQNGLSKQQQQAVAQAMKQAVQQGQQQANNQAGAQQMAQATQALSQAMQQAAQGQQGSQGASKPGQGAQASAQQQGSAAQSQGQQGQQPGQGGQGQTAQQQMQQQVSQLQAMAKDQQAVAAGQQGAGQQPGQSGGQQSGAQQAGAGQNQGGGQGAQANGQAGPGQGNGGQFQQGDPQQGGQGGQGGAAVAAGGKRPDPVAVAFGVKKELSESQTNENGMILAKSFVKAPAEKGESKLQLSQAVESESKEAAEEIEQDRIPRNAQKAVKEYFETLKNAPPK